MNYMITIEDRAHVLGVTRCATVFNFVNTGVLTRGASQKAIAILYDCIDLAQAHAYGHLCFHIEQLKLPIVVAALEPLERYEKAILDLLNKHNTIVKKR